MPKKAQDSKKLFREFDPNRGSFEPNQKEPSKGVRHVDKTRQDMMPKEARPRYQAWLKRLERASNK